MDDGHGHTATATVHVAVGAEVPEVAIASIIDPVAEEQFVSWFSYEEGTSPDIPPPTEPRNTASFLLTRTGDLGVALTVYLSLGGTATAEGSSRTEVGDYGLSTGQTGTLQAVTFRPGESSQIVTLTALPDDLVEDDEEALIQIAAAPNGAYLVGFNDTATLRIVNKTDWNDGLKKSANSPPILLDRLTIDVAANDRAHPVRSNIILERGREYLIVAYGEAKIGPNAGDVVDAEYAYYNDNRAPQNFVGEDALRVNVGLRAAGLWGPVEQYWGAYQASHVYGRYRFVGQGQRVSAWFQDVMGQYGDNAGTLTIEIGEKKPFGDRPPAVDNNPPVNAAVRNATVVIVVGDPAERARWVASARAQYGANAFIYNTVYNAQDLANVLAQFPVGSIRHLNIGGHGATSPNVGVQIANNDTAAPAGSQSIDNVTLGGNENRVIRETIALRLTNDALVWVQSCGGNANDDRIAAARDLANLLQATVRFASGSVTTWETIRPFEAGDDVRDPRWHNQAVTVQNEQIRNGRQGR